MVPGYRSAAAAFTLIELLIVIAVIAILVGLLIPAAGMVRTQAYTVKCMHNMQQIASVVEVYVQNDNGTYPGNFGELVTAYALPPKILICPLDTSQGKDPLLGRAASWPSYSRFWDMQQLVAGTVTQQLYTSYDYECSGWVSATVCQQLDIDFFYRDEPLQGGTIPTEGTVSWADCKAHEAQFGNLDINNKPAPFPASVMPIIRCYHHLDWNAADQLNTSRNNGVDNQAAFPAKVNNICLDFSQAWTIPFWEIKYNPNLVNYP